MVATQIVPVTQRAMRDQLLLLVHADDSPEALRQIVHVLESEGYSKEKDMSDGGLYGRGSKGGRFLGGGLSSRQEFRVTTIRQGGLALIAVKGTASVADAGAMGISKMRKELARLVALILPRFGFSPEPHEANPEAMGPFLEIMIGSEAGRGSEYAMVIILVLTAAVAGGLAAAWAIINR